MATIAQTDVSGAVGAAVVTKAVLTASDTFALASNTNQILFIENDTGASVTAVIKGADATTVNPGGIGAVVDLSAGFSITVPAGAVRAVALKNIIRYLNGVITVTGAVGASAWLVG